MSDALQSHDLSDINILDNQPFTETDHEILKSYEAAVDGLAMLIGEHCEIVLHSFGRPKMFSGENSKWSAYWS
ncbi:Uncharacterized protein conserved in bacteria [Providencia rustigianii]|nr:Uncharacterized protein conserved in bacteria [Providencia rustigianii]